MAAGADVSLIDELGMVERSAPTAVAVRAYVRSPVEIERMLISFDREIVPGYAWIFPLPDHEYNVGVGVLHDPAEPARHDLRALFDTFCREVPEARRLMDAAEKTTPLRGARLRCGLDGARARGPGSVVAVGEQIGTTFPFTGEGIGKAMETGEMAAEQVALALEAGDPAPLDAYVQRLERELRPRYHGYLVAQRWLGRPWLNDLVSRRMRRGGWMAEAARGIVVGDGGPGRRLLLAGAVAVGGGLTGRTRRSGASPLRTTAAVPKNDASAYPVDQRAIVATATSLQTLWRWRRQSGHTTVRLRDAARRVTG